MDLTADDTRGRLAVRHWLVALAIVFVVVSFGPVASAQNDGVLLYCPDVGYRPVCPDGVEMPVDDSPDATDSLPRTGSNRVVPLAKGAIVLIGVAGALTLTARRKWGRTPARSGG